MITVLALILLILRLLATRYLWSVVKTQRELLRLPVAPPDIKIDTMRKDLHYLTIALLLSNFPAILMDIFFFIRGFGFLELTISSLPVLVFYTVSNSAAALLAAKIIAKIYKDAIKADQIVVEADHILINDK